MPDAIVLVPTGSGQTSVTSGANLVTQIARIVGGESESQIRSQALDCLNRVRIELNNHDWRFMKTTDSAITLVDGQQTYSLQRTFRKPSYACLVDVAGDRQVDLEYFDDVVFSHLQPTSAVPGAPLYYLLRNDYEDGLVSLFPIPDAAAAATYRLVVEYYARIEPFSDSADSVALPEEIVNPLVIGGQAYILRERDKNTPMTMQAFADYQRVKTLLLVEDRRYTEERTRFRLAHKASTTLGRMFIIQF